MTTQQRALLASSPAVTVLMLAAVRALLNRILAPLGKKV